jgi:hypothetical protein
MNQPPTSQNGFLILAFGSLGVVYGDIGTSPLYAFASVFTKQPASKQDILGAASLTFWMLTIVLMLKYVVIVLRADDHGEGELTSLRAWHPCACLRPPATSQHAPATSQRPPATSQRPPATSQRAGSTVPIATLCSCVHP